MDLKGSLIDANLRIYPSSKLTDFLKAIPTSYDLPHNITQIIKNSPVDKFQSYKIEYIKPVIQLTSADVEKLKLIREKCIKNKKEEDINKEPLDKESADVKQNTDEIKSSEEKLESVKSKLQDNNENKTSKKESLDTEDDNNTELNKEQPFLVTSDIDWMYEHIRNRRDNGEKDIPYLHNLLEGASIEVPENETIKRNPILEARCVKLRAQQETREYRKMTKSVDNVRLRFPEDSISYQLKQLNRQLIAIGQFIISIFAGFLFGFRGVEWIVGNLDFGFRLLLGVMCALIIALAEIYFLAKKLNEELSIPETVQLGGPVKFADQNSYIYKDNESTLNKEHQD